jgi:hypothetical protein
MMVTDLSHLAENSLWPTSQHSGTVSDRSVAHAAPGTPSLGGDVAPQPFTQPRDHERQTLKDGNEPPNPSPFTEELAGWARTAGRSYPNTGGPQETRQALLNSNPRRSQ